MCTREIYNNSTLIKENDKYTVYCNGQNVAQFYNEHAKTLLDCFDNKYKNCESILYFEDEEWKAIQIFRQDKELVLLARF
jgi:mevalonate pyrophosphate decarboxylase